MLDPKEIINIIVNVLFVATFLGIFFFTYASKVEQQVVENQVDYLVSDFADDLKTLPSGYLAKIKNQLSNIKRPDLSAADAQVDTNNKAVLLSAIKVISIVFCLGMLGVFFAAKKWNLDLYEIIKRNLIILVFIGFTEFTFLTVFAKNFISVDPNYAKLTIINKLTE